MNGKIFLKKSKVGSFKSKKISQLVSSALVNKNWTRDAEKIE